MRHALLKDDKTVMLIETEKQHYRLVKQQDTKDLFEVELFDDWDFTWHPVFINGSEKEVMERLSKQLIDLGYSVKAERIK